MKETGSASMNAPLVTRIHFARNDFSNLSVAAIISRFLGRGGLRGRTKEVGAESLTCPSCLYNHSRELVQERLTKSWKNLAPQLPASQLVLISHHH